MVVILVFEINNPKLISTNDAYYHPVRKTKSGRYMSYFCKSENLKILQKFYEEKLNEVISDNDVQFLSSSDVEGLELRLLIGMPSKEIYEHDGSNFIKTLEDCIVKRIKVDDSRNIKVSIEKFFVDGEEWKLVVSISPVKIRNYDDIAEEMDLNET